MEFGHDLGLDCLYQIWFIPIWTTVSLYIFYLKFSGKPTRALDTLYDVIKSKKRNHQYSEKLIEQIMNKYLELCVDLKKSHVAKEGLFQYRNMCQATNVASLASVVQGYLSMAERRFVFLLILCKIFRIEIKARKF